MVNGSEFAGVGYDHFMSQRPEQLAHPARMRPDLQGNTAEWQTGELPLHGPAFGGQSRGLQQITILIEQSELGVFVSEIQSDEKHAIL